MLIVFLFFFDVKGVVREKWVPEGSTVNQYYYKQVLEKLRKKSEEKDHSYGKTGSSFTVTTLLRTQRYQSRIFWREKKIPTLDHPPHSLD